MWGHPSVELAPWGSLCAPTARHLLTSDTVTLPLRPFRLVLTGAARTIRFLCVCHGKLWFRVNVCPTPLQGLAWGCHGLTEIDWAGLGFRIAGKECVACLTLIVSLLGSLNFSEPGFSVCKVGSTVNGSCPRTHRLWCFQNNWRKSQMQKKIHRCEMTQTELILFQNPRQIYVHFSFVQLGACI